MNRYQKILTLSIEDMANFLSNIQFDSPEPTAAEMLEWLRQEYDRDENDLLYISTDRLHEANSGGCIDQIPTYDETAQCIETILKQRHKLTAAQADEAIRMSPFKYAFQSDPAMASHTSNEEWAKKILSYWDSHKQTIS